MPSTLDERAPSDAPRLAACRAAARRALAALGARGWTAATAESCTGGLIGALLTSHPGSSSVFRGGVVAYADEVKVAALGVPRATLADHGAVSGPVACAMALGARGRLGADAAVSVTGIAGPDGGSRSKPVGTVWIGLATPAGVTARRWRFESDREAVRRAAAMAALQALAAAAGR